VKRIDAALRAIAELHKLGRKLEILTWSAGE